MSGTPSYSIIFWAQPFSTATLLSVGDIVLPDGGGSGGWVTGTTAARGTRRSEGLVLTSKGGSPLGSIEIQTAGTVDASLTGLGAGIASWVRCSATGRAERFAAVVGGLSDIIGWCETDGRLHLSMGVLTETIAVGGGGIGSLAAGDGIRVTSVGTAYTVTGVRGSCSPETFGAKGDDSTDDTLAIQAALDAIKAGTYTALELGGKIYKITSGLTWNFAGKLVVRGQGPASAIHLADTVTTGCFICRNATDLLFSDFQIYGNATYDQVHGTRLTSAGGDEQNGVEVGYLGGDGTSRLRVVNMIMHNLGGKGLSFAYGADIRGMNGSNISVYDCHYGIYAADAGVITGFSINACTTGIYNTGGNVNMACGDVVHCGTATRITAGGNDAHGSYSSVQFRHCDTNISIAAIVNGHSFNGCLIYQGIMNFDGGNVGAVQFNGGIIDATTYTLLGLAKFNSVQFDQNYFSSASTTGGQNYFVGPCQDINGTVPPFISTLLRKAYTFPSDANQALSKQDSVAEILAIGAGVVTATRTITNALSPDKGIRQIVKNGTAQSVTFQWATGTGVTLTTGLSAIIGADGTNAVKEIAENASGGGEANTMSSSGGVSSIVQAKSFVNLPVRGFTGTSPIVITQNTNDLTFSLATVPISSGGTGVTALPGSSGQLFYNNAAALGATANLSYDGTGLVINSSGYIAMGTSPAGAGLLRVPFATQTIIGSQTSLLTNKAILTQTSSDVLQLGSNTNWTLNVYGAFLSLWGGASGVSCASGSGGNNTWLGDGTNFKVALPICGWATTYTLKVALLNLTGLGSTTSALSAANAECPILRVTAADASTTTFLTAPATLGAYYIVDNRPNATVLTIKVAGQTGVTIQPTKCATMYCNGTDYVRVTADI